MSKREQYQILLFGDTDVINKYCEYLGFIPKGQSGMVYFEFPNEKFAHKQFLKLFPYSLRIYVLQPQLLSTLMSPKRQFQDANAMFMLFNNNNDSLTKECYEYYEKVALTRKSFIPLGMIGYNEKDKRNIHSKERFYFNLEIRRIFEEIFGIKSLYLEINEGENEALFFARFTEMIEYIKDYTLREYSTIAVETMVHNLRDKMAETKKSNINHERGIYLLGELEREQNTTITRQILTTKYGIQNPDAKNIIDFWETRLNLGGMPEDELALLENDCKTKMGKLQKMHLDPNLVNLMTLGYDVYESKKIMSILKEIGQIKTVPYHVPPVEFEIYDNLQDMIILSKGRMIYSRSNDPNNDQVTLFSGLIQTIEIVRDKYLSTEGMPKNDWLQVSDVEFLEFGNLHTIIGKGSQEFGLKVILRFKQHPQQVYIEKTKEFIKGFEQDFSTSFDDQRVIDLEEIKPEIDKFFAQYFNPFPQKIPFDKKIKLNSAPESLINGLTEIEKEIIDVVKTGNELTIPEILRNTVGKFEDMVAESDILPLVFDLIKEKILF